MSRDLPMDKIWCEEVIISTVKREGCGHESNPIRVITQVFLKDGTLIAEHDPIKKSLTGHSPANEINSVSDSGEG